MPPLSWEWAVLSENWPRGRLYGLIVLAPGRVAESPRTAWLSSSQKPELQPTAVLLSQEFRGVADQKQAGISSVFATVSGIRFCKVACQSLTFHWLTALHVRRWTRDVKHSLHTRCDFQLCCLFEILSISVLGMPT